MRNYRLGYDDQPTTVIAFVLTGDMLDPRVITTALGVTPAQAWAKGDERRPGVAHRTGYWALEPTCSPYEPFDSQLELLLEQLEALPTILQEFVHTFAAGIAIGHSTPTENFGFHLDQQTMERLCRLHVSLDFDLYVHQQGEEKEMDG